ncbi:MAG: CsgG/HfaB family protein [Candidatus Omnitrophica bacterium]|nr:CsgG/HfaB family protein [Candidatus Omnitrophota bacterium]
MKKFLLIVLLLWFGCLGYGGENSPKIILIITEQNISGPQHSWWASEIDLSITETTIAKKLIEDGFTVLEPSSLNRIIRQEKAFRLLNFSEQKARKLGSLAKADYVILGKAVASSGRNVPQSNMRSCFANITVKVIRIKDGKVVDYLDSFGAAVHLDPISGGKEALINAAEVIAEKISKTLTVTEGGKK